MYDSKSGWERWKTKRCGALGVKLGMRGEVDIWGNVFPVTLLQLQENEVFSLNFYGQACTVADFLGSKEFWVHNISSHYIQVLRVKGPKDHQKPSDSDFITLQVGAGLTKWKNLNRSEQGQK